MSGVQRKPTIQRTAPTIEPAAAPARKTYRPPFAPKVSDPFAGAATEDVVPTLSQTGAADAEELDSGKLAVPASGAAGLQRGRSIKERVSEAIRARSKSKSGRSLSVGARPTASAAEAEASYPPASATTPTDEKLSFVGELVRRVSRRQTTARPRRAETDVNGYRPSLDSRLSRADLKQPQHANLVPYAAPAEAGIRNAPALSSYAPRPPLRPRAQSAESIGARTAADYDLPPSPAQPPLVYSATLGQVASEYRARRAKTLASVPERGGRSTPASRQRDAGGLAPDASTASRRAERRSKLMQEVRAASLGLH